MSRSPEEALQQLLTDVHTLQIASIRSNGLPNISYAPYIRDEHGTYYIFISQLASHTQDLIENPAVAILLTLDEQDTKQIFARTRVTYQCQVERVLIEEQSYSLLLDQFAESFGNVVSVLRDLPDFILFRLTPESGRFVMGFGQAYELTGDSLQELLHIK
ncbi:MAG: pyridoxamine 5'-phosphate oxidase family protein [Thiotrichaceae bacterium]